MSLVLSLFPGIGLLDMAFEAEGFCVVRGPDLLWGGDIRQFHPPAGRFDGVIGGPPCQSFSSLAHLVRARGNEPRFGNLIPEFERCVAEARPEWFLMENVPAAPTPDVVGYGVAAFLLEHDGLDAGDGYGHEQMRTRRFSFGLRDAAAPDLRRWLQLAALKLPKAAPTVIGHGGATPYQRDGDRGRVRTQAVTGGRAAVEVAIGGSGNRKPGARVPTVVGGHSGITAESERRRRVNAVCGGHGKSLQAVAGGGGFKRYSYKEACRLQGLPEDFLADSPFLKDAKRDMVAAGVPLPMGRAIARAVNAALAAAAERTA